MIVSIFIEFSDTGKYGYLGSGIKQQDPNSLLAKQIQQQQRVRG